MPERKPQVAGDPEAPDPDREERRRVRRRRRARLKAALLGRSRGGLTSKVRLASDPRCRPLAFVLTEGQAADSPRFVPVLDKIKVRGPIGRPRNRPDAIADDKAYSSRANRAHLRKRNIKAVIPEKADQAANRKEEGMAGRAARFPRRRALQRSQQRRTLHQQNQGMARPRDPLRQDTRELPRWPPPARSGDLDTQPPPHNMITTQDAP
ncbi:transposase [Streptomyces sp. NPDC055775]